MILKKYTWIILTVIVSFLDKVFLIGIQGNETILTGLAVHTIGISLFIMIVPCIIIGIRYLIKKEISFSLFNKYIYYSLGIFFFIAMMPNIYKKIKRTDKIENKIEHTKVGFKELLISEKLSIELDVANKYETVLNGNLYSNYYFNISTDFPDSWKIDRGMSKYSIFRGHIADSGMMIALIVIPTDISKSNESFQTSPLLTLKNSLGTDYKNIFFNQLVSNSQLDAYNFQIDEEMIRSYNYLKYSYNYYEIVDNEKIVFKAKGYNTFLWGCSFTIMYSAPEVFFNSDVIDNAVFKTNYINSDL